MGQRNMERLAYIIECLNVDGDYTSFVFADTGAAFADHVCQLLQGQSLGFAVGPDFASNMRS